MAPETLRIVLEAGLRKDIAIGRRYDSSRLSARPAGRRGEQVDPWWEIVPGGLDRPGPLRAAGRYGRQASEQKDRGYDRNVNAGLAHPTGTAAVMPTEVPLSTP